MKNKDTDYYLQLFNQLSGSWDLRKEVAAFNKFFKKPIWILLPLFQENKVGLSQNGLRNILQDNLSNKHFSASDINKIFNAMKTSQAKKHLTSFEYGKGVNGCCYPFRAGQTVFAFILLINLQEKPENNFLGLIQSFTDTILRETQKEIELEELNETIRPRVIALSTVHTVHRIMSSTLNLNELLPRIARLSLQVMKANRCSIKLLDRRQKNLLPKVTVDLRKEKTKLKKIEIGKYAPGKAVKQGRIIRGKHYIATPLTDGDVVGVITLYDKIDKTEFTAFDEEIMKTLAEQAVIAINNAQLYQQQESLTMSSIKCIAMLLKTRHHHTHPAEGAMLKLCSTIGQKLYMNETQIKFLQYASMLHDTGQMAIPEEVLMKKGELTGSELDIVKAHPMRGANILGKSEHLKPIVPIILYHHENYDGSGYPKGFKGDEIPLSARILAVVSAFEAMITEKPYRKALTVKDATKEIKKGSGSKFDPEVVKAFQSSISRKSVLKKFYPEPSKKGKKKK